jgi:hypothetical protein
MKSPFRAARFGENRGYHMRQRTDRAGASARQPYVIGAARSANIYHTSEVLTAEVMHRYLLMMKSYKDAA